MLPGEKITPERAKLEFAVVVGCSAAVVGALILLSAGNPFELFPFNGVLFGLVLTAVAVCAIFCLWGWVRWRSAGQW
jgi:hypothetical protein